MIQTIESLAEPFFGFAAALKTKAAKTMSCGLLLQPPVFIEAYMNML
ncbi:hypothetical protein [Paralcaligenes ureilyticus]|nr:hypothetical protein [Paralcaligenes ureilyticus]